MLGWVWGAVHGVAVALWTWLGSMPSPSWSALRRCTYTQRGMAWIRSCVPTKGQALHVWLLYNAGAGMYGQLGNNATLQQTTPVAVSGSHTFTQLSAGSEHTCGLLGNGSALCWGEYGMQAMVLRLHCGPGLVLCPLGLPCVAARAPNLTWYGSAAACPQVAKQCMCVCCVVQDLVKVGSWAMAPLHSNCKLPQWLCLAHTALHS